MKDLHSGEIESDTHTHGRGSSLFKLISCLCLQAICIKDISPNLQSCEPMQDGWNTFRCRAEVLLALDSLDCLVV